MQSDVRLRLPAINKQLPVRHSPHSEGGSTINLFSTRDDTDEGGLTRIPRISANEPMHADFLRGAHAPRVQCSAPSRNTRETCSPQCVRSKSGEVDLGLWFSTFNLQLSTISLFSTTDGHG